MNWNLGAQKTIKQETHDTGKPSVLQTSCVEISTQLVCSTEGFPVSCVSCLMVFCAPKFQFMIRSLSFGVLILLLACVTLCVAQAAPEKGKREMQIWGGGGRSVPGGTSRTGAFN